MVNSRIFALIDAKREFSHFASEIEVVNIEVDTLAQLLKKPKKMSLSQFAVVLPQLCTTGQLWFIHCQSKQDIHHHAVYQ